jgi:hypothetical protein
MVKPAPRSRRQGHVRVVAICLTSVIHTTKLKFGEASMRDGLIDSPYTKAKKAAYKLFISVKAVLILLLSAWRMKPSHFRPETESIYKNLGWGIPLIPGGFYGWATQCLFGAAILKVEPGYPIHYFSIGSSLILAVLIYFSASLYFGFHALMCGVGKVFKMVEVPPPYEFFSFESPEHSCGLVWQLG